MAGRKLDDYKPLSFYKKHTKPKKAGFSKISEGGEHFFCRYVDGDIALISQAYSGVAGRDNGIESVRKNEKIKDRYRFEDRDGGKYGFSLLAGNGQEVAVSPDYSSKSKAEHVAGRLNGSVKAAKKAAPKNAAPKKAAKKVPAATAAASGAAFTSGDGRRGNYKPLNFYETNGGKADGFNSFDQDGAYYFSYRDGGKIALISEAYTAETGRDNGIASVKKNMPLAARYKHHTHKNGKHYFDLHAGNHQEIATSPWYDTDAASKTAAATLRGEVKAKAPRKANVEDNYKSLAFYKKNSTSKVDGFDSFKGDDGQYYFVYREHGQIRLVSESYPTAAARDTGMASVKKNMSIESRYDYKQRSIDNKDGFGLRAGNNKEIARSVGYGSAAAALTGAAYLMGKRQRPKPKPKVAPVAAAAVATAAVAAKPKPPAERVDDYLRCEEYHNRPVNDRVNNVALFKHENGQFYFALYDADGDVRLRSEGFRTAEGRDEELSGVLRLKDDDKYYKRIEQGDHYMDVLYDETGREVGRSCLRKVAPPPPPKPVVAPVAAAAAVAGAAALGAGAMAAAKEPEPVAPPPPPAPVAVAEGGGIWGWLRWLLLGLLALAALFFLFKMCSKPSVPKVAAVTCWNGTEADSQALCPQKVTCWDGSFETNLSSCPAEPVTCSDGSVVPAGQSCPVAAPTTVKCWDGSEAASYGACPAEPTVTCWDGSTARDTAACPARPTKVSGLFGTCPTAKSVNRLGTNPEFGDSRTLDAAGFYNKLNTQYAVNSDDRNYLNYVARQLGYSDWTAVPSTAFSDATVPYGTKGVLGYGQNHGYQCSSLNLNDRSDLAAFRFASLNGKEVYFMKRCGNFFFPS